MKQCWGFLEAFGGSGARLGPQMGVDSCSFRYRTAVDGDSIYIEAAVRKILGVFWQPSVALEPDWDLKWGQIAARFVTVPLLMAIL